MLTRGCRRIDPCRRTAVQTRYRQAIGRQRLASDVSQPERANLIFPSGRVHVV